MPKFNSSWTLESGPPEAPHVLELDVGYTYSYGTSDSWMEPGDPAECEIDDAYGKNDFGEEVRVSLVLQGEQGFFEYIAENPPEPDYEDYYYD